MFIIRNTHVVVSQIIMSIFQTIIDNTNSDISASYTFPIDFQNIQV